MESDNRGVKLYNRINDELMIKTYREYKACDARSYLHKAVCVLANYWNQYVYISDEKTERFFRKLIIGFGVSQEATNNERKEKRISCEIIKDVSDFSNLDVFHFNKALLEKIDEVHSKNLSLFKSSESCFVNKTSVFFFSTLENEDYTKNSVRCRIPVLMESSIEYKPELERNGHYFIVRGDARGSITDEFKKELLF